jgi:putative transposase
MNLSQMVGNLKAVSARGVRQEFEEHLARYYWKKVFWNSAYGVVSAGGHASLEAVLKYIQDQSSPSN